jgi:DNA-binding MarR family transcriptional regulator
VSERRDGRLAGTVSFRLLTAVNRMTRPFHRQFGRRFGVTLTEWRCLMALAIAPDVSGQDVAAVMGMDRMTVSRTLRRLEAAGRAVRRSDPSRPRRGEWRLTPSGWEVVDAIMPEALARDAALFGGADPADLAALGRLLARLEAGDED